MSENESPDSGVDQDPSADIQDRGQDWFLQTIVDLANVGLEMGVTLMIEGTTISGTAIGGKRYFELLGEMMLKAEGSNETIEALATSLSSYGEIYQRPDDADETWRLPPAAFIHLRNAKIFSTDGTSLPSDDGFLWRGKIEAVSGFSVGMLSS